MNLWPIAHPGPLSRDPPGKNTRMDCQALLEGDLPDPDLNLGPLTAHSLMPETPGSPIESICRLKFLLITNWRKKVRNHINLLEWGKLIKNIVDVIFISPLRRLKATVSQFPKPQSRMESSIFSFCSSDNLNFLFLRFYHQYLLSMIAEGFFHHICLIQLLSATVFSMGILIKKKEETGLWLMSILFLSIIQLFPINSRENWSIYIDSIQKITAQHRFFRYILHWIWRKYNNDKNKKASRCSDH